MPEELKPEDIQRAICRDVAWNFVQHGMPTGRRELLLKYRNTSVFYDLVHQSCLREIRETQQGELQYLPMLGAFVLSGDQELRALVRRSGTVVIEALSDMFFANEVGSRDVAVQDLFDFAREREPRFDERMLRVGTMAAIDAGATGGYRAEDGVHVTRVNLSEHIVDIRKPAEWLEEQIARYSRTPSPQEVLFESNTIASEGDDVFGAAGDVLRSPKPGPISAKHIYLDVVDFSKNRTTEAQTSIINSLNRIIREAIGANGITQDQRIFLPVGDGACITLLNVDRPFDVEIRIALVILKGIRAHNDHAPNKQLQFEVRVGINQNLDDLTIDINGNRNIAGAGINEAQRLMSVAGPSQIVVGEAIFNTLKHREGYSAAFRSYTRQVKHGLELRVHQLIKSEYPFLSIAELEEAKPVAAGPVKRGRVQKLTKADLLLNGPVIKVRIAQAHDSQTSAPDPALEPEALDVMAIIDTAASATVINVKVAETCALAQTGITAIATPGGVTEAKEFLASLAFPDSKMKPIPTIRLIGSSMPRQQIACVLGRDVLQHWKFTYDGKTGSYEIED